MGLAKLLPLSIVMIAGPQILSAVFIATSEGWKRNSAAYVLGAATSISVIVALAFVLGIGAGNAGASNDALYIAVLVLLGAAALHTFLTRNESKDPPKWMGKLQRAEPKLSYKLGFLLLGFFPTDVLTAVGVGGYLASQDEPFWHYLPFLALTLLLLSSPAILVIALGPRGEALLPKVRDWMNDNSWVVNEVVILFFVALTIDNLV